MGIRKEQITVSGIPIRKISFWFIAWNDITNYGSQIQQTFS